MRALRVAVLVKNTPNAYLRDMRPMGYWSYPVPEFEWDFMSPGKSFKLNLKDLKAKGYDMVFHEDGGNWGDYLGDAIPVIYLSIDSTVTAAHLQPRLSQGKKADLFLVEHDDLNRFTGATVFRFPYCVNDNIYHPYFPEIITPVRRAMKDIDINFHNGGGTELRQYVRSFLDDYAKTKKRSYVSGAISLAAYSVNMARSRVVVNIPRNPMNRPHRIMDAMASGCAVVTYPVPDIGLDDRWHWTAQDTHDIAWALDKFLEFPDSYLGFAVSGYNAVLGYHTWRVRATELRGIVNRRFGI